MSDGEEENDKSSNDGDEEEDLDLCSALACVKDSGTTNTGGVFLNHNVPQK